MLILRPGELQIRPNGFAQTDSPERSVTFLLCHTAEGDGKNPVSTVWMDSKFARRLGLVDSYEKAH